MSQMKGTRDAVRVSFACSRQCCALALLREQRRSFSSSLSLPTIQLVASASISSASAAQRATLAPPRRRRPPKRSWLQRRRRRRQQRRRRMRCGGGGGGGGGSSSRGRRPKLSHCVVSAGQTRAARSRRTPTRPYTLAAALRDSKAKL